MPRQPQTLLRKPQYEAHVLDAVPPDLTFVTAATPLFEGDNVYWTGAGIAPVGIGTMSMNQMLQNYMGVSATTFPLGAGVPGNSAYGYWGSQRSYGAQVYTRGVFDFYTGSTSYPLFAPVTVGGDPQTVVLTTDGHPAATAPVTTTPAPSGAQVALPAATYDIQYLFVDANGEVVGVPSLPTVIVLAAGHVISVAGPTSIPAGTTAKLLVNGQVATSALIGTLTTSSTSIVDNSALYSLIPNSAGSIGIVLPREAQVEVPVPMNSFPFLGGPGLFVRVGIRARFPFYGGLG